jgi:hypothetical protein
LDGVLFIDKAKDIEHIAPGSDKKTMWNLYFWLPKIHVALIVIKLKVIKL